MKLYEHALLLLVFVTPECTRPAALHPPVGVIPLLYMPQQPQPIDRDVICREQRDGVAQVVWEVVTLGREKCDEAGFYARAIALAGELGEGRAEVPRLAIALVERPVDRMSCEECRDQVERILTTGSGLG